MTFARNGPQICVKWKDTRDVLLLSTVHSADMKPVTVKARGGAIEKFKPVAIDYNTNKTGVDRGDQLITYYPSKRKTLKWWKKMVFHLFKITIVNSFILFKKIAPPNKTLSLKNFMLNLAQQPCEIDDDSRNHVVIYSISRLKDSHFKTLPELENHRHNRYLILFYVCRYRNTSAGRPRGLRGLYLEVRTPVAVHTIRVFSNLFLFYKYCLSHSTIYTELNPKIMIIL